MTQIRLDFSSTNADGLIYTRTALADEPVAVGMDVLGVDEDGNTCTMQVVGVKGQTVYLRPDWDTWQDGPVTAVHAMIGDFEDVEAVVAGNGDVTPAPASGTNLLPELALA